MDQKEIRKILEGGEIVECVFDEGNRVLVYAVENGEERAEVAYDVFGAVPVTVNGSDLSEKAAQETDGLVRRASMRSGCIAAIADAEKARSGRKCTSVSLGEDVLDACAMSMLTPSKRGNAIVISETLPGRCEISDGVDEILPFSDRLPHLSDPQYTSHIASLKQDQSGGYVVMAVGYAEGKAVCSARIRIPENGRYAGKMKEMVSTVPMDAN